MAVGRCRRPAGRAFRRRIQRSRGNQVVLWPRESVSRWPVRCSLEQVDFLANDTRENGQPPQMNLFNIIPCAKINSKS